MCAHYRPQPFARIEQGRNVTETSVVPTPGGSAGRVANPHHRYAMVAILSRGFPAEQDKKYQYDTGP
jgi:hypothetical protein